MTAPVVEMTLGDLGEVHPDIEDLPASVLDTPEEPDLDIAGLAASEVYNNWPDERWRNAFIMALAQHIENQSAYHRAELQDLLNRSRRAVFSKGRRAIVKHYINDVLNEMVAKADEPFDESKHPRNKIGEFTTAGRGAASAGYDRAQAASLASSMLTASTRPKDSDEAAEFVIRDRSGKIRTETYQNGVPKLSKAKGERIIRVRNLKEPSVYSDTSNVATMLGANYAHANSAGMLASELSYQGNAQYGPNSWFNKLEHASGTLHHATNNDRVRVAAAMGKYVGRHGPEVSRVLGPHMRRLSYKYRGYDAPASQWTAVARAGRQEDSKGKTESTQAFEHKLALSLYEPRSKGGLGAVPTEAENELLLKTGNTAPSHGYILDRTGTVRSQAQGYADDHYVPFNLKDLAALNHGSYVRSRTFGGPTTEDIALAMKTGAKSVTIASRNGLYNIQFTPQTDKTGKKIGAWAKDTAGDANEVMVNRYGRLLDGIKAGKVNDPETGEQTQLNGRGYEIALQALQRQFPYHIKSVSYTPAKNIGSLGEGRRASVDQRDTGYVRPYYLKPSEAVQGYYDTLLGGPNSYDELDSHRLGRARYWAAQKKENEARARRQEEADAQARRIGQPTGSYPWNRPTGQAMGGHEWGKTTPATPAGKDLERGQDADTWTREQTGLFLKRVHALLDHVQPGDPDLQVLHQKLRSVGHQDSSEYDDLFDAVRHNTGGIRDSIYDDLDDLSRAMGHDQTGLGMYRTIVNDPAFAPHDPVGLRNSQDGESMDDLARDYDFKRYQEFQSLFGKGSRLAQLQRDRGRLSAPKQKELEELEQKHHEWMQPGPGPLTSSRFERMTTPSEDYDGLNEVQWMENRIARAQGLPLKHKLPSLETRAPAPETSATAVTEEMDEDEAERQAQRYAEQQMKDLEAGDIDGYGHRNDDWPDDDGRLGS